MWLYFEVGLEHRNEERSVCVFFKGVGREDFTVNLKVKVVSYYAAATTSQLEVSMNFYFQQFLL